MEFVPPFAPMVVLAFLGTALLLALGGAVFLYALLFKKQRLVVPIAVALVGVAGLYAAALLASSALSRERVLHPQEKKYFCEIDCHLAYSVERVEVAGFGADVSAQLVHRNAEAFLGLATRIES